jgi:hypothetical protein
MTNRAFRAASANDRARLSRPRLVRWFLILMVFAGMALVASPVFADIAPPEPSTIWGRNQAPDKMHVMMAGIFLSAAIVAGGLLVAWQVGARSRVGKTALVVFAAMFVVAAVASVAVPLRIQWENEQWQDWERRDAGRRARGGDRWPDFVKEREQEELRRAAASTAGHEATRVPAEAP